MGPLKGKFTSIITSVNGGINTMTSRIVFFLVLTTLVITTLLLLFCYNTIYTYDRRITIQSVENSFQLISSVTEQDLRDLSALILWCSQNSEIIEFLESSEQINVRSTQAWQRLSEQYINNRSGPYVRRLIVFDRNQEKFLQVGNSASSSEPVTIYNLQKILNTGMERSSHWQTLIQDPYSFREFLVLPLLAPVVNYLDGNDIGTVFLAASPNLIIDKFSEYNPPPDSMLFLYLGENYYQIINNSLLLVDFPFTAADNSLAGHNRVVLDVKDSRGKTRTMVRIPVREGIAYIAVYPEAIFSPLQGNWPFLFIGLGITLVLLITMSLAVRRMTRELTNNIVVMKELENAACMDALTCIYNRRHFSELAHMDIVRAVRQKQSIYAAMLDLDFFKNVNDAYGHSAGDAVLRMVAEIIRQTIRSYDLLGRYGGEEFVLLITGLDERGAPRLMERIRENIANAVIPYDDKRISITCSIGLAKFVENDTLESTVKKADEALYAAKNSGRNQVRVYAR